MGRRTTSLAFAALLLAVVAASCTDSSNDRRAGGQKPPPGVFRIGLERPQSLDPAQARFPSEVLLAEQLFDGLTGYDPATLAVRSAIAATWQASEDQKRWEFTIRPDARFANGRQITSEDVRYTLERIARKGSGSPAATQLELVEGFEDFNTEDDVETLEGVTAPAPETLVVELTEPFSALPAVLGNPTFGIVPRESVEAQAPAFAEQPVGSGPFTVTSRNDQGIQLAPVPGAPTQLTSVDIRFGAAAADLYAEFERGALDWAPVPPSEIEQVADRYGRDGFRPYLPELFYGFNLKNPKFADARFREAIVRAIDREAIVRAVFGGRVRVATGLVADGVPGFQPGACGERCHYDPARAQALVQETFGGGPAPEISIDFDDDPTQQAVAQAIQANLKAVGIPAGLRPHAYADYLQFAVSGDQELFRLAWIGAYPSPDAYLTPLFVGGSPENVTGFESDDVDDLLAAARAQPDEAARTEAYRQAERLILEQLPVLPIAQYEIQTVVSDRVEGLVMSTFGTFDAAAVRLK